MTSLKLLSAAFAGLAALAFAANAGAHGATKPQHGGVVQMTGETLVELVPGPAGVALYVIEEDEDVESSAVTVKLTVTTAAGAKSDLQMTPSAGNKFEAKGMKVPAGSKVGVMVINKATQARSSVTFAIK